MTATILPFVSRNTPSLYEQRLALAYQTAQRNHDSYNAFLQVMRRTVASIPVIAVPFLLSELTRESERSASNHWALCHVALDCCDALITFGSSDEAAKIACILVGAAPLRLKATAEALAAKLPVPVRQEVITLQRAAVWANGPSQ